jgi:hypothetical protein
MAKLKVLGEVLLAMLVVVAMLGGSGWMIGNALSEIDEEIQAIAAKTYKVQMPVGGRLWTPVYYCDEYGYDDSGALVLTDCYRYEEVRIEQPVGVVIIKQGGQE